MAAPNKWLERTPPSVTPPAGEDGRRRAPCARRSATPLGALWRMGEYDLRAGPVLALLSVLLCLPTHCGSASEAYSGIALGVHGGGNAWSVGTPTVRWRPGQSVGLDFTPSLSYSSSRFVDHEYSYHFEVGYTRTVRADDMFLLSLRIAPGYSRSVTDWGPGRTDVRYSIDLCVGPEFEYFLPVLPALSVGVLGGLRLRYSEFDQYSYGRIVTGDHGTEIEILGQWLTVRYYF